MTGIATTQGAERSQDQHALSHSQHNLRILDFPLSHFTPHQLRHIEHKVVYLTALMPGSSALVLPAQTVSTHKERYFDLTKLPLQVGQQLSSSAAAHDFGGFENLAIESVFLMKSISRPGKVTYSLEARFSPRGSLISEREGIISIPIRRKHYETLKPYAQSGNLTRQTTVHSTSLTVNDRHIPVEYRINTTRGFGHEKATQRLSPSFVSKNIGIATIEMILPEEHFVAARDLLLDSSLAPSFVQGAIPAAIARENQFKLRRNAELASLSRDRFLRYHQKAQALLESQTERQPHLLTSHNLSDQQAALIESELTFVSVPGTGTPDNILTVKRQAVITQSYFAAKSLPLRAQTLLESSEELRLFGGSLHYLPIRNVRLRKTTFNDGETTYSLDAKFRVSGLLRGQRIELSVPISEKQYKALFPSACFGTVVKQRTMCEDTFTCAGQSFQIKVEVDRLQEAGNGKRKTMLAAEQVAVVDIEAPSEAFSELRSRFLSGTDRPPYLSPDHIVAVEDLEEEEQRAVSMRSLARNGLTPEQFRNLSMHLQRHHVTEYTA